MIKIWKELDGYPNYKISNMGEIYSVRYKRLLNPSMDKNGYLVVTLMFNKKRKTFFVHRLVAKTFLENPNNLPTVNHKDENKQNNRVDNLEYMTFKDNVRYSQSKKVYQYDLNYNLIKVWDSVMDIERTLNINSGIISSCCNKRYRYKTSHNFIWSYTPLH